MIVDHGQWTAQRITIRTVLHRVGVRRSHSLRFARAPARTERNRVARAPPLRFRRPFGGWSGPSIPASRADTFSVCDHGGGHPRKYLVRLTPRRLIREHTRDLEQSSGAEHVGAREEDRHAGCWCPWVARVAGPRHRFGAWRLETLKRPSWCPACSSSPRAGQVARPGAPRRPIVPRRSPF